ncbi:hypothetical protein GCM10011584_22650 [Nocardioides phosphati]|uniref:Uncharacterized protein n=1 Tax=Nocardioides phosphati TaxID=1867775 RepID=A0ABQ2NC86_9ACTN|nr:Pr6Pr family membrane protein [Nocardioides phosphati]GGO90564.1 hypothetical protein GCM10011584_22650 [Nocardioides phosphati]
MLTARRAHLAVALVASAGLVPPLLWLAHTLVRGAVTGFYPYPFLDAGERGYPVALATCLGVAVLFLVLACAAARLDDRLSARRS